MSESEDQKANRLHQESLSGAEREYLLEKRVNELQELLWEVHHWIQVDMPLDVTGIEKRIEDAAKRHGDLIPCDEKDSKKCTCLGYQSESGHGENDVCKHCGHSFGDHYMHDGTCMIGSEDDDA